MPAYPESRRTGDIDDHHGRRVADPYRWMEATDSPPVRDWVQAQNALSQPYLEAIPARERIRARLAGLWAYEQFGYAWMRTKGSSSPCKIRSRAGTAFTSPAFPSATATFRR